MDSQKLLFQAIKKLIAEKPIDKIRVREILEEADVSRATFYKHYANKYELANAVYENHVTTDIMARYDGHNWSAILTEILEYIVANLPYYQELRKSQEQGSFFDFLTDYSYEFYRSVYCRNQGIEEITKTQEYRILFITAGNVRVLQEWMMDGRRMPVDEFVEELLLHTPREYYEYIDECGA